MYIYIYIYSRLKLTFFLYRVGLELPTVEVRYQNLSVEAECEAVRGESIPTLWNAFKSIFRVSTDSPFCNCLSN